MESSNIYDAEYKRNQQIWQEVDEGESSVSAAAVKLAQQLPAQLERSAAQHSSSASSASSANPSSSVKSDEGVQVEQPQELKRNQELEEVNGSSRLFHHRVVQYQEKVSK